MNTTIGFPTLGDLIKFIYDAFGVLARKRGLENEIDETEKKSLQTALSRLANEECDINEKSKELIKKLANLIAGHIRDPRTNLMIGEVLIDILEVYQATLKDDTSFLDKKGTMKWFLLEYGIKRFNFSIKKHFFRFNVSAVNLTLPEGLWFLPSFEDGKIIYPIEKVMSWIYHECSVSPKDFHYPDRTNSADHEQQERNLENALNWIKGESLPSLSALLWNFNSSISHFNNVKHSSVKVGIDDELRNSFCIALTIARASTCAFKIAKENYDLSELIEFCEHYRKSSDDVSDEFLQHEKYMNSYLTKKELSQQAIDKVWFDATNQFVVYLADRGRHLLKILDNLSRDDRYEKLTDSEFVNLLRREFGRWTLSVVAMEYSLTNSTPELVRKALSRSSKLMANVGVTENELESFLLWLKEKGIDSYLPWMPHWIKGQNYFKKNEYPEAFDNLKNAYEMAKYRAGHYQSHILSHFLKVAAINRKRKEFKQAGRWARYLGLEVYGFEIDELSEENLDSTFEKWSYA
ncbi:hypothetical protein [Undibacterium sp. SXout20W]|uniref:hypothetical protein n=1 Tax=Undibacterium sp. SXout20W TaxID=3413051 RepID=UPI003BF0BF55